MNRYAWIGALVVATACAGLDQSPHAPYVSYGGCGNLFVYATTGDGLETLVVSADRRVVPISERDTTFDLPSTPGLSVHLEVLRRRPTLSPYCNDVVDGSAGPPTIWQAQSGRVTIRLDSAPRPPG